MIKRYDRTLELEEKVDIPRLAVVHVYNAHMGGVDLLDAHVARYKNRMKSPKWYLRLFYHFIDVTLINMWIMWRRIYKLHGIHKKESLGVCKEGVATTLCRTGTIRLVSNDCGFP